ncbi:rhomboid-like protein [Peterkaempfera griseoplana]|uniref:rhomboid-like protein n=1 Tax=Peterkaempfera griseoplana TaxID=66896 RepID=UPI0007C7F55A|nr:rhomboid-like protein [Peterkaempfera griseoplana]
MADTGQRTLRPLGGTGLRGRLVRLARLLPAPGRTPFTFWYLLLLLATSLYARYADPVSVRAAVVASSTDGWHLLHVPLRVLLLSALWTAGPLWSPYLLAFGVALAPLERRTGPLRTLQVFATGHVLATLASELPLALRVLYGPLAPSALHRVDIGVSYGVLACLGALTGLLPGRLRYAAPAVVAAVVLGQALTGRDPVTAIGHPAALLVGLLHWPLVRRWAGLCSPEANSGTPWSSQDFSQSNST